MATQAKDSRESFQLSAEAAERYETEFVPALFAQWAPILCDAARVMPGDRVLDVACGTGVAARIAADCVAPGGNVVGVDVNEAMLAVARRVRPDVSFRHGDAEALPFPDGSFDVVLCQMALMFFADPAAALREMARVAAPGASVGLVVPSSLDRQAAFAPFAGMVGHYAGPDAMELLAAYFAHGDLDDLGAMIEHSGLKVTAARRQLGTYCSPSVDAFVTTEVEGTPLRDRISDDTYERIRVGAHDVLFPFTTPDGTVEAPFECNLVVATPPLH